MIWEQHFEKELFNAWIKAGFPNYEEYIGLYVELREHKKHQSSWLKEIKEILPGVSGNQLHSVYGFGVVYGKIIAGLLNLNEEDVMKSFDWCGRLNLGISLFDHLCDNHNGLEKIKELPAFSMFYNNRKAVNPKTDSEILLNDLARSVLTDVKQLGIESQSIMVSIYQMYQAEIFISSEEIHDLRELNKVKKALYLKSALPFKVMAEYLSASIEVKDASLVEKAKMIGEVLGYFYWMIDDARDVWDDLTEGHWNWVLYKTFELDPSIIQSYHASLMKEELSFLWKEKRLTEIIINNTIHKIKTLFQWPLNKEQEIALGLFGASLWMWWKY